MSKVPDEKLTETALEYIINHVENGGNLDFTLNLNNGTKEINNINVKVDFSVLVFIFYDIAMRVTLKPNISMTKQIWQKYCEIKTNCLLLNKSLIYPNWKENDYYSLSYTFAWGPCGSWKGIGLVDIDISCDIPKITFTEINYDDFVIGN